ncbi:MAG TPA: hypothetical protein VGT24_01685 [Candidatus Acidoferrales bacterium]|nr:hypothetical protein [Candidatus Acidoferrales bacterium]
MSEPMTLSVTAICVNCDKPQPLDKNARCLICGSDSIVYPKPRDARTAFAKHLYSMLEKMGA